MTTRDGVDVASFQGAPGTWQAAAGGIGWAAVKLTELSPAGYIDPDAAADWAWLKQAGKGRIGYLFGHPQVAPTATVAYFIAELARLGLDDTDAVALDIETAGGRAPAQVSAWTRTVLASLRANLHRMPLLYTFPDFIREGYVDGCGGYPLWISDPNHPAGHPGVPAPWSAWAIHQYETAGQIDRDVIAYPDVAAMQAALGKHTTPQAAAAAITEEPMLILNGANADTPIALPDGAKTVRLAAVGTTTVNVQFHGAAVQQGIELTWPGGAKVLPVPAGSHFLRVFRPADGNPDVPVSAAVS
jgi:lysozyme